PGAAAERVAAHVFDLGEYLTGLHVAGQLDQRFGAGLGRVAYHAPCHLRVQEIGFKARDLLRLVPDTSVEVLERCTGMGRHLGLQAGVLRRVPARGAPVGARARRDGAVAHRLRLPARRAPARARTRPAGVSSRRGARCGLRGQVAPGVNAMEPVRLEEILGRERYGAVREAVRRRIIEHKRGRRVTVGDRISLLFEDRATVWYQTQEMIWVEQITDLDAIREELAVYDALLPRRSELSATLLIEIGDQSRVREELAQL